MRERRVERIKGRGKAARGEDRVEREKKGEGRGERKYGKG